MAQGFGLKAVRVEKAGELGPALEDALKSPRATFIDVATQSECEEMPPVHRWLVNAGLCPGLEERNTGD